MAVRRFDVGEITEVIRLDNGYLKAPARITKVGVFTYRNPVDGSISRELRPPEEVFHADSMASFGLVPLTNDHPPVLLNAKNTRKYQVGSVSSARKDSQFLAADVLITDEDAIKAAQKGKRELSCGYTCDTIAEPGVTRGIPGVPDGIEYDAVQRNIRGNHVALVTKGRAGSEASLRLDHGDMVMDGFNPDQPRDPDGKFGSGGGMGKAAKKILNTESRARGREKAKVQKATKAKLTNSQKVRLGTSSGKAAQSAFSKMMKKSGANAEDAFDLAFNASLEAHVEKYGGDYEDYTENATEDAEAAAAAWGSKSDSADDYNETENENMRTIKIDGVDFEVSEQAYQAYQKALAKFDSEYESMSKAKAEAEKLAKTEKERADKLQTELAETKKKLDASIAPDFVKEKVSSRISLVRTAEKILNDSKVKFDEMDDNAVRVAVIKKVFPNAKLDGKDETYILARFDSAVETAATKPATNVRDLSVVRGAASGQPAPGSTDRVDSDDPVIAARERMRLDNANAYKADAKS